MGSLHQFAVLTLVYSLQDSDKEAVKKAASKFSTHALIGSLAGLGLGAFLAFRLRANRNAMYQAFKAAERPTHVRFANGREEAIPDLTNLMKPSTLGDIAAYTFFSAGGVFIGGEAGLLTGSWSAKRSISRDPEVKKRVERAFKGFQADVYRKKIEALEGAKDSTLLFE